MRNAPSPYSPPTPMPALMTSANTRTPLAVWRRSRDPFTCWVNRFSTAVTLASISWADRAEDTPGSIKLLTSQRQTAHAMLLQMCRPLIAVASSTRPLSASCTIAPSSVLVPADDCCCGSEQSAPREDPARRQILPVHPDVFQGDAQGTA